MSKKLDLTNQRFGMLIALKRVEGKTPTHWLCLCDCGKEKEVSITYLKDKRTKAPKSCGCMQYSHARAINRACYEKREYLLSQKKKK